ncbi:MAG: LOG family protein [Anaerolineae bacterium]|nr:LOG family protein [Anaerolineae bacterium]RIK23132.1 MAG: DNA-binding protein [Anaerolineae bacterium]
MGKPVISVFGSSSPQPESEAYADARLLGSMLAEAGFVVATGGYGGTMAAVSQGAAEAGGWVIGVTASNLEKWRPMPPNQWVAEEIRHTTLKDRLLHLVTRNDAMVALPGGIGTLSEVALAWSLMQTGESSERPLVLLGPLWRETVRVYAQAEYIKPRDLDLLYMATSAETAVGYLRQRFLDRLG